MNRFAIYLLLVVASSRVFAQPTPVCSFDFQTAYTNLAQSFSIEQNGWTFSGEFRQKAFRSYTNRVDNFPPGIGLRNSTVGASSNALKSVDSTISVYLSLLLDDPASWVDWETNPVDYPKTNQFHLFSQTSSNQVFDKVFARWNPDNISSPLGLGIEQLPSDLDEELTFFKKVKLRFLQFVVVCSSTDATLMSGVYCNGKSLTDIPTEPIGGILPSLHQVKRTDQTNVFNLGTPDNPFPATLIKLEIFKGKLAETNIIQLTAPPTNVVLSGFFWKSTHYPVFLAPFRPEWYSYEFASYSYDLKTWKTSKDTGRSTPEGLVIQFGLGYVPDNGRLQFRRVGFLYPYPLVDIEANTL